MDREPLGDVPMGKYKVLNTVTRIVPDELVEWNVGSIEHGRSDMSTAGRSAPRAGRPR